MILLLTAELWNQKIGQGKADNYKVNPARYIDAIVKRITRWIDSRAAVLVGGALLLIIYFNSMILS